VRSRLVRGLLDEPVVYNEELSEEALAYLATQRGHVLRAIEEGSGLVPEVRAEGIAMTRQIAPFAQYMRLSPLFPSVPIR